MDGKIAGIALLVLSALEIPIWQYVLARQQSPRTSTLAPVLYGSSMLGAAIGLALLILG